MFSPQNEYKLTEKGRSNKLGNQRWEKRKQRMKEREKVNPQPGFSGPDNNLPYQTIETA